MDEVSLTGGFVNAVIRVGDTVRRPVTSVTAHRVLRLLETRGWSGAPRFLGVDDQGREILTFIDGHVPWACPSEVASARNLTMVARMVREFHDLTADTDLVVGGDVMCHNDLAPRNTVYRDHGNGLEPVAFIDWDMAAPGARIHDVAHVCWQFLGLGPACGNPGDVGRKMKVVIDAYGLDDRDELIDAVLWWQERCWRGIRERARAGDPAMRRLDRGGTVRGIQEAYRWTKVHRQALERAFF